MSDEKDNGGPAFPFEYDADNASNRVPHTGMTLRDYFAGLIYPEVFRQYAEQANRKDVWDADWRRHLAADAYAQAAAMIAERNRIMNKP